MARESVRAFNDAMGVAWTSLRAAVVAAGVIGLGLAAPAQARTLTAKDRVAIEAAFAKVDTNADGRIQRDEAAAVPEVAARFDALDRNKDGALSLDEFAASMATA